MIEYPDCKKCKKYRHGLFCVKCNYKPKDIVEVVRCKDCRHWKENHRKVKYCNKFGYLFGINDFCSYGERAE